LPQTWTGARASGPTARRRREPWVVTSRGRAPRIRRRGWELRLERVLPARMPRAPPRSRCRRRLEEHGDRAQRFVRTHETDASFRVQGWVEAPSGSMQLQDSSGAPARGLALDLRGCTPDVAGAAASSRGSRRTAAGPRSTSAAPSHGRAACFTARHQRGGTAPAGARWVEGFGDGGSVETLVSLRTTAHGPELGRGRLTSRRSRRHTAGNVATWDGAAWKHMGSGNERHRPGPLGGSSTDGSGPRACTPGVASHGRRRTSGVRASARWGRIGVGDTRRARSQRGRLRSHRLRRRPRSRRVYGRRAPSMSAARVAARRIASWDPEREPGPRSARGSREWMLALAVFDAGSGPALHAGGTLSTSDARRTSRAGMARRGFGARPPAIGRRR
jgi:hypothetical protein